MKTTHRRTEKEQQKIRRPQNVVRQECRDKYSEAVYQKSYATMCGNLCKDKTQDVSSVK